MAQLVADTLADLDAQQLPTQTAETSLSCTSIADNVSVIAPVALMLIVDAAIVNASRNLHVHLNDQRIDLQGSPTQRDTAYELLASTDQRIADWVVHPDISGSPDDIAILFANWRADLRRRHEKGGLRRLLTACRRPANLPRPSRA